MFGESNCNFSLKSSQPEDVKPMSQRAFLSEWISDFFHTEREEVVASFCRQFRRNVIIFCFCSSMCSVQLLSHVWLFVTPWTAARQASLSITNSQSLPKLISIEPKYWSFSFNISLSNEHPGLVGSPCGPRDSQESSPAPQFKSINSSVLSFLHSPTLISTHDYWKNRSLD